MSNNSTNQRKKKQRSIKLPICILILLIALIAAAMILSKKNNENNYGEITSQTTVLTAEDVQRKMVLSADDSNLKEGVDQTIQLTLYVPDELNLNQKATVTIHDDAGNAYGTMTPSDQSTKIGYHEYSSEIEIKNPQAGTILLHAEADQKKSMDLTLYCTPEVTEAMVRTCYELGQDLYAYLDQEQIEEKMAAGKTGYSEEKVLKKVKKWLDQDERCMYAEINGPNVLYLTHENIIGAYVLPAEVGYLGPVTEEEIMISSHKHDNKTSEENADTQDNNESEQTSDTTSNANDSVLPINNVDATDLNLSPDSMFAAYNKDESLDAIKEQYPDRWIYQDGLNSITNKNFMICTVGGIDYKSKNVLMKRTPEVLQFKKIEECADEYVAQLNYQKKVRIGEEVLGELLGAKLQQNGIISLTTHGTYIQKAEYDFLSAYYVKYYGMIGNPDKENIQGHVNVFDQFLNALKEQNPHGLDSDLFPLFYVNLKKEGANKINLDMARMLIDGNGNFMYTSNLIKDCCQKTFYDNSVFLINCCYGLLDYSLADYVLNHGVKLIAGYDVSINQDSADSYAKLLLNEFLKEEKTNKESPSERVNRVSIHNFTGKLNFFKYIGNKLYELNYYVRDYLVTKSNDKKTEDANKPLKAPGLNSGQQLMLFPDRTTFTLESYGNLSGKVMKKTTSYYFDKDGNLKETKEEKIPASDVKVLTRRFINQAYEEKANEVKTGYDGSFTLNNQIWGVLGMKVSGNTIKTAYGDISFTTDQHDCGEVEVTATDSSYEGLVAYRDANDKNVVSLASGANVTFKLLTPANEEDAKEAGKVTELTADGLGHIEVTNLTAGNYEITGEFQKGEVTYSGTFTVDLESGHSYFHEDPLILEGEPIITEPEEDEASAEPSATEEEPQTDSDIDPYFYFGTFIGEDDQFTYEFNAFRYTEENLFEVSFLYFDHQKITRFNPTTTTLKGNRMTFTVQEKDGNTVESVTIEYAPDGQSVTMNRGNSAGITLNEVGTVAP